jgi:hypothetical protein
MIFQCPHCSREFQRRAALRNHIKTHENVIDKYIHEIEEERRNTIIDDNEKPQYTPSEYTRFDLQNFDNQLEQQLEQWQEEIEYDNTDIRRGSSVDEIDIERETNIEEMDIERETNIEEMDIGREEEMSEEENVEREMEDVEINQVWENLLTLLYNCQNRLICNAYFSIGKCRI